MLVHVTTLLTVSAFAFADSNRGYRDFVIQALCAILYSFPTACEQEGLACLFRVSRWREKMGQGHFPLPHSPRWRVSCYPKQASLLTGY